MTAKPISNRITEMTGTDYPIIQAPMGWIARAQLASAVSNAGGLGVIETSSGEFDNIRAEVAKMRELTDKPFGMGKIGFLAETAAKNLFAAAANILDNDYTINRRMRLDVQVMREGKEIISETVLNDIVINRGALARLASIVTYINGEYLTTFKADGLIVATPTGSTAYSLAAGGPVIHPDVPGIIISPICPFTLTNRPLIVPDAIEIKLKLETGASDIMLTFDGQKGLDITDKDTITVRKSPHPLNMIALPDRHYFNVLKAKLRWSGGRV